MVSLEFGTIVTVGGGPLCRRTKRVFPPSHPQVHFGRLLRRLPAQTPTATEISTNKPRIAVFSAGVVLTAAVLMATAGKSPTLTTGLRPGCSVMNWAIGGLIL